MKITKTKIEGVYVIEMELRQDVRGYFTRVFCKHELREAGVHFDIVQINRSKTTKKGTVRGMHYQNRPYAEDKIIQCVQGAIFDVALDLRKDSLTYGEWFAKELTADNNTMLLVPKGCAHGFQSLRPDTVVEYFVSEYYTAKAESGIRWDDSEFAIDWPLKNANLSEKDAAWPLVGNEKPHV